MHSNEHGHEAYAERIVETVAGETPRPENTGRAFARRVASLAVLSAREVVRLGVLQASPPEVLATVAAR
jgi:hypothetical protein